ncbi:MAG: hypothetical protein ACJ8J7_07840 [Sulfurifustaceae bacterium]
MKQRPTSITVVSWILIVLGAISLVTSTIALNNPQAVELMGRSAIPLSIQYVIMYVGIVITLVCGIMMLKGQGWARILYVVWSIVSFGVGLLTSPVKVAVVPGLVIFLIIAFFLFRPRANEYFRSVSAA